MPANRAPAAPAPAPEIVERARELFDAGNAHYAAGRYQEAVSAFQAGYALVPRPSFLVNLGQAYRRLGDLPAAKNAYVAYLRALPEDSPLRDQALQVLAEIEVSLQESRADGPPTLTAAPPVPPETAVRPAPMPAAPPADPGLGRRWIGVATGIGGLALLGTGTIFELRARGASQDLSEANRQGGVFDADKHRIGRRDERLGVGLLIAGTVVTAVAVLVYTLIDGSPEDSAQKLVVGAAGAGLGGGVRF